MKKGKPNQPNITYLLGAGASFGAIPIVKEFSYEIEKMLNFMVYFESSEHKNTNFLNNELSQIRNELKMLDDHYSVDTLARKYWLKYNAPNTDKADKQLFQKKYNCIKKLICALIIFRRLDFNIRGLSSAVIERSEGKGRVAKKLDLRYDGFFSALLSNQLEIPQNIKIVSWNYDFQIEQAFAFYHSFVDLIDCGKHIGIKYRDQAASGSIVKLNGSSVLFRDEQSVDFKEYGHDTHIFFSNLLKNGFDPNLQTGIKFAWEDEDFIKANRKLAAGFIKNSQYVVVIGYSFPIFNRETDIELFKEFRKNKSLCKIFIQAPEGDAERYISQLESIGTDLSSIAEPITNLDQFFIPNQFWNPEEEDTSI